MTEDQLAQIILDELQRQAGAAIWGTKTLDIVAIDGDISPRKLARAILERLDRDNGRVVAEP